MPPKKILSKSEKWSLGLSAVAISFSIITPVIGYYWLDPQLQAFRNRARLQISSPSKLIIEDAARENIEEDDKGTIKDQRNFAPLPRWKLDIENVGNLPAKDVQIIFRYPQSYNEKQLEGVTFEPPLLADIFNKDGNTFVTLKKPIAPQGKISATVMVAPDEVIVSNEFGESSIIKTEASLATLYNNLEKKWISKILIRTPQK